MILKFLLLLLIMIDSYGIVCLLKQSNVTAKVNRMINQKNQQYYQKMLKEYQKKKVTKAKTKENILQIIASLTRKAQINSSILFHPFFVVIICILFFGIGLFVTYPFFQSRGLTIISSVPIAFLPIYLLEMKAEMNRVKIEKAVINFLLQLKNYTNINNDIIYAMKQVKTVEPLQGYINHFLIQINSGISFENAIISLSNDLDNHTLNSFFSNLTHCYLYGGDFSLLIAKSYQMVCTLQKEREKRQTETKSARIVLWILIFLDLLVYFTNIRNNYENFMIMKKSVIGNIILYWNLISIWFLMILSHKVKKMDDE